MHQYNQKATCSAYHHTGVSSILWAIIESQKHRDLLAMELLLAVFPRKCLCWLLPCHSPAVNARRLTRPALHHPKARLEPSAFAVREVLDVLYITRVSDQSVKTWVRSKTHATCARAKTLLHIFPCGGVWVAHHLLGLRSSEPHRFAGVGIQPIDLQVELRDFSWADCALDDQEPIQI